MTFSTFKNQTFTNNRVALNADTQPFAFKNIAIKNRVKKCFKLSVLIGVFLLTGCEDRVLIANEKMAEIRGSSSQPVESAPQSQVVEGYVYNAGKLRSPFMPPSLLNQKKVRAKYSSISPKENRTKEALESFNLLQLSYKGRIQTPNGTLYGLIKSPDGNVHKVKLGDYMGKNHGRIVGIEPSQINLVEIVPHISGGYAEKPTSITLAAQ